MKTDGPTIERPGSNETAGRSEPSSAHVFATISASCWAMSVMGGGVSCEV